MAAKSKKTAKKKVTRSVTAGRVYIQATFNNTIVSFTDEGGSVLNWSSAGNAGFKGARKSTPYAATTAAEKAAKIVTETYGLKSVDVFVKGPGPGRDAAIRGLKSTNLEITSISDNTPIPHNGVRGKKRRKG